MNIEDLPPNCLAHIFSFLNWSALQNVTLTSKYFNETISKSSKLLEIVRYIYGPRMSGLNINESSRHYTRFNINSMCFNQHLEIFMEMFKERMENIQEISININNIQKIEIVIELLKKCKRLRKLEIKGMSEKLFKNVERTNLTLNSLIIGGGCRNLEIFSQWNVKHLKIYQKNLETLPKFLKSQNNLEALELDGFCDYSSFISDDFKFKLKSLTLENCDVSPNLTEFLQKHEKTLKNVTLLGLVTSTLLNSFKGLKNLNLKITIILKSYKIVEPLAVMSNVTSLDFSIDSEDDFTSHFDGKFPNVKKLKITGLRTMFKPFKFDHLEELSLDRCVMKTPLITPKVKILKFAHVPFQMLRTPFDFKNNSIEQLHLDNCFFIAWFYQFLDCDDTRLKYVRLNQSRKDIKVDVLERNYHKIDALRIYNYYSMFNV